MNRNAFEAAGKPTSGDEPTLQGASTKLRKLTTLISRLSKLAVELGGARDNETLRTRLQKSKEETLSVRAELGETLDTLHKNKDLSEEEAMSLNRLASHFAEEKKKLDDLLKMVSKKEKEGKPTPPPEPPQKDQGHQSHSASTDAPASQQTFDVAKLKAYDISTLDTEKAIQKEKLTDIKELEKDLLDLNVCYKEFNDTVHEQQHSLDHAQQHISDTNIAVEQGIEELKAAGKYQKSSRKKMCVLLLLLLGALAVAGVVVFVSKG
eukprot:NODE_3464_length_962_cov_106.592814_g3315_i0.p1 GENE.NODE_3464_length_962_cov_106.592814_g3315_i0~~NODE_3464_length_962_cov_106.592814_g3315_i0.p1  ORF type:complete len:265 (+),score=90.24 NODE_3464_length_962_cov_106.592814_g3315_i0:69-863(+)